MRFSLTIAGGRYVCIGVKASNYFMPKETLSEKGPGGGGWILMAPWIRKRCEVMVCLCGTWCLYVDVEKLYTMTLYNDTGRNNCIYHYIYTCMLASKESSQVHTPVPPPTVHRKYISHRQNTETHIPKFQHPNVQNINCRITFSQKHHRHYFTSSSMFCLCFFVKHVWPSFLNENYRKTYV